MTSARASALFVGATFVAMLAFTAGVLVSYAENVPYQDQWLLVPWVVGREPRTFAWFWSQLNEHRLPLPRLVHVVLHDVTGGDFRAPLVFHVAVLAAATAMLVRALARLRGRAAATDAMAPALLLSATLAEGSLHGFSTPFVLVAAIGVAVLALALGAGERLGAGRAAAIGALVAALALCGFSGVVAVVPLALWLVWAGARSGGRAAVVAIGLAVVAVALAASTLIGLEIPAANAGPRPLTAIAVRTSEALAMSLGAPGAPTWPGSPLVVGALGAAAAGAALLLARHHAGVRVAATGAAASIAALLAIAAAIGYGRAPFPRGAGFGLRYATAMAPLPIACYAACVLAPRDAFRSGIAAAIAALVALAVPSNLVTARSWMAERRGEAELLERDAYADLSIPEIAQRQAATQVWGQTDLLAEYLGIFAERAVGPWSLGPAARVARLASLAEQRRKPDSPLVTPPGVIVAPHPAARVQIATGAAIEIVGPCELRYPLRAGRHELVGEAASGDGQPRRLRFLLSRFDVGGVPVEIAAVDLGTSVDAPARLSVPIVTPASAILVVRGDGLPEDGADAPKYVLRALEIRALDGR